MSSHPQQPKQPKQGLMAWAESMMQSPWVKTLLDLLVMGKALFASFALYLLIDPEELISCQTFDTKVQTLDLKSSAFVPLRTSSSRMTPPT